MKENEVFKEAVNQIARSVEYMLDQKELGNTKIYNGIITSLTNGVATIQINGKVFTINQYGTFIHVVNDMVKVFVPQGNMNLAFFI